MKPVKTTGIQYAALPWRLVGRDVQVLLITSRGTGRWVIPKGWPIRGMKPQDAAALEASEEAGVVGEIDDAPIGSYHYVKQLKREQSISVQVIVFAFRVRYQADDWKEQGQRHAEWFRAQRAARLVAEPALRRLIADFGAARAPTLIARGIRTYRNWRLARA